MKKELKNKVWQADLLYFSIKTLGIEDWPVSNFEDSEYNLERVLDKISSAIWDEHESVGGIKKKQGLGEFYDLLQQDEKFYFGWENISRTENISVSPSNNPFVVYLVQLDSDGGVKLLDKRREGIIKELKKKAAVATKIAKAQAKPATVLRRKSKEV